MIRPHHWLIALALAFGVHLMAFAVLAYNDPKGDAADQGVQGIEIDLGMLGDLGEAQETEQPKEVAPPKPQVTAPPPPEPDAKVQIAPSVPKEVDVGEVVFRELPIAGELADISMRGAYGLTAWFRIREKWIVAPRVEKV